MGSDLFRLVVEVLPGRFGGAPTDYRLAEEGGENGLPRISIVVAPRMGPVDEAAIIETALDTLRRSGTATTHG
jgi:hypothetical protein